MTPGAKPIMSRRDGNVSILRPWVSTLTIQAQGTLMGALRGPDGVHKNGPAKALVRALRATIVNNAKDLGPDDVFMGDGTGVCREEEVDVFFDSVDVHPHHWYLHFLHAAAIVGYTHPNEEIRKFWDAVSARAAEDLHLSPEPRDAMLERLRRDGTMVSAGGIGPCPACGHDKLVEVLMTDHLRTTLGDPGREHGRAALCANCLAPRTARPA